MNIQQRLKAAMKARPAAKSKPTEMLTQPSIPPKPSLELQENSSKALTKPKWLSKKDDQTGKRIKVGRLLGTVQSDLSVQFVVQFDNEPSPRFVFKREKHSILEE